MSDFRISDNVQRLQWDLSSNQDVEKVSGWQGSISREGAETLLQQSSEGTYVIRSGDDTSSLAVQQLSAQNHQVIQHYLLVVKGEGEVVQEHLILHTHKGWMIYSDEPNLHSYAPAPHLSDLLNNLGSSYRSL